MIVSSCVFIINCLYSDEMLQIIEQVYSYDYIIMSYVCTDKYT